MKKISHIPMISFNETRSGDWNKVRARIFNNVGRNIDDTRRIQIGIRIIFYVSLITLALSVYTLGLFSV